MSNWSAQDAKTNFAALLQVCVAQGPQIVTRRGAEVAVVASLDEWRRLQAGQRPALEQAPLMEGARGEDLVPLGGRARRRRIAAN